MKMMRCCVMTTHDVIRLLQLPNHNQEMHSHRLCCTSLQISLLMSCHHATHELSSRPRGCPAAASDIHPSRSSSPGFRWPPIVYIQKLTSSQPQWFLLSSHVFDSHVEKTLKACILTLLRGILCWKISEESMCRLRNFCYVTDKPLSNTCELITFVLYE